MKNIFKKETEESFSSKLFLGLVGILIMGMVVFAMATMDNSYAKEKLLEGSISCIQWTGLEEEKPVWHEERAKLAAAYTQEYTEEIQAAAEREKQMLLLVDSLVELTSMDEESVEWIITYAKQFDVEPSLVLAIISKESNFHSDSVGSSQDRGYMQIIPSTEKMLATRFGETLGVSYDPSQIFEAKYNIGLGVAYIAFLQENNGGDLNRALSEYNRGAGNLAKYYAKNGTYETEYSKEVLKREKEYQVFNQI